MCFRSSTMSYPITIHSKSYPFFFIRSLSCIHFCCIMYVYSEGKNIVSCRNPYVTDLEPILYDAYMSNQLDAFGLYVYGMVLAANPHNVMKHRNTTTDNNNNIDSNKNHAHNTPVPTAASILIQSILKFPYNWSAWLDLASCIVSNDMSSTSSSTNTTATTTMIEQEIEELIQPILGEHYMYHFFCAHIYCERHNYYDAMLIYEQWMDVSLFTASPYLRSQYAICCFHMRNYTTAKTVLQELHITIPYRLEAMDVYSNVLYVLEDSVALSQLAHVAVLVDKYRAETCCIIGNYYSIKKHRAKAIQHFQRALLLDRTFTSAYTLIGHEYVEWKQTANAMDSYRKAVQISPRDYRAWYGLGQTYELLNMNLHALYYYKQATQLRPYDPLMWCALGSTYTQINRPSDAIMAYERALQQNEYEMFATQKLAVLYHNNHRMEDAAQCYMRHLELVSCFNAILHFNLFCFTCLMLCLSYIISMPSHPIIFGIHDLKIY
jgi:anaphase-promoting complex subunit 8